MLIRNINITAISLLKYSMSTLNIRPPCSFALPTRLHFQIAWQEPYPQRKIKQSTFTLCQLHRRRGKSSSCLPGAKKELHCIYTLSYRCIREIDVICSETLPYKWKKDCLSIFFYCWAFRWFTRWEVLPHSYYVSYWNIITAHYVRINTSRVCYAILKF